MRNTQEKDKRTAVIHEFEELEFEFTVISRNHIIKDKRKYLAAIAG
jgi:hypothetical protein